MEFYSRLLLGKVLKDMKSLPVKEDIVLPKKQVLQSFPSLLKNLNEQQMMELALIENLTT